MQYVDSGWQGSGAMVTSEAVHGVGSRRSVRELELIGLRGRLEVPSTAREGPRQPRPLSAAVAAVAPVVQVRANGCTDRVLYDFARRVVEICAPYATTGIVNDRVDVALAVGATGTYLGTDDLPIAAAVGSRDRDT